MPDWTKPMTQSYEYYIVDPSTLADVERLDYIKSASLSRDSESATLGSATIDTTESIGETYIRCYLKTVQNGVTEKHPLGTYLVQTPATNFNGVITELSMDAYTPLIELKENQPPLGYFRRKDENIMVAAYEIVESNARAPVQKADTTGDEPPKLHTNFVSNTEDTWLSFVTDLIAQAKYRFDLDERGNILFVPQRELSTLPPVWTFDDGNSSILQPDISVNHDIFGIPNVVEVIYVWEKQIITSVVKNDDPESPISTVRRGREIKKYDTSPNLSGPVTQGQLDQYAEQLLRSLSTVEYTVSYTHGYCPVRVGDCVRLNYEKAGLKNVKAKVVSQNIKTSLPCTVSEKAVFTTKLWR
jgi:hypothetical protein